MSIESSSQPRMRLFSCSDSNTVGRLFLVSAARGCLWCIVVVQYCCSRRCHWPKLLAWCSLTLASQACHARSLSLLLNTTTQRTVTHYSTVLSLSKELFPSWCLLLFSLLSPQQPMQLKCIALNSTLPGQANLQSG